MRRNVTGLMAAMAVSLLTPPAAYTVEAPTLASLAWMAGHWIGAAEGSTQEELWLAPRGALMPGLSRETTPKGKEFFEFVRIEARADGIYYVAQPGGRPPTEFKLVEASPGRALFANPAHDFPRAIEYTRAGDRLHAHLEGAEDGKTRVLDYEYRLRGAEPR